jgi:hypothetical protein
MNLAVYVRLLARRGVFIVEALYWYALNVKEAVSFRAHGF